MSKEYLEALNWLLENEMIYRGRTRLPISPVLREIKHRLESIDNSNPSEALECLESIKDALWDDDFHYQRHSKLLDTIEQALLKAQEPKKYLKWEDLEFSFKEKCMKVKLNENIYTLRYTRNELMGFSVAYLEFDNTGITIIDCKKQFFNDLHLERVEE